MARLGAETGYDLQHNPFRDDRRVWIRRPDCDDDGAMMPDNQALQVFYGTLPLIFVIAGAFFRSQILLKDIITRLTRLENWLIEHDKRLTTLETMKWR